jgi:hypothetical protein
MYIVGVGGGGGGKVECSRSSRIFGTSSLLLAHLLFFFIGVTEDNDLAIVGRPEYVAVEVTKKTFGELLMLQDICDETFLIRR